MLMFRGHSLRACVVPNSKLFSDSAHHAKSLYETLGITSKATQSEVKAAYYELSKIYHPDKNEGCQEAADKFRDITEAYEVLGNLGLRRRYDKGILHRDRQGTAAGTTSGDADESFSKFYDSRTHRSRPPTVPGSSRIYNFDEWAQAHYTAAFVRRQSARQEYTKQAGERLNTHMLHQRGIHTACLISILMAIFLMLSADDYDVTAKPTVSAEISPKHE